MPGIWYGRNIPSSNPSQLNKSNCVVEKFLLRGLLYNQSNAAYRNLETPRLKRASSAPNLAIFTRFAKGVRQSPSRTRKNRSDAVAGSTSASSRAVPLHAIVTLSSPSYPRTNLYACRQIAFQTIAKSSRKCSAMLQNTLSSITTFWRYQAKRHTRYKPHGPILFSASHATSTAALYISYKHANHTRALSR